MGRGPASLGVLGSRSPRLGQGPMEPPSAVPSRRAPGWGLSLTLASGCRIQVLHQIAKFCSERRFRAPPTSRVCSDQPCWPHTRVCSRALRRDVQTEKSPRPSRPVSHSGLLAALLCAAVTGLPQHWPSVGSQGQERPVCVWAHVCVHVRRGLCVHICVCVRVCCGDQLPGASYSFTSADITEHPAYARDSTVTEEDTSSSPVWSLLPPECGPALPQVPESNPRAGPWGAWLRG